MPDSTVSMRRPAGLGAGPRLAERLEPSAFLADLVDDPQQFARRARQPVELGYHQHLAWLDGDYMTQTPFHSSAGGSA